MSDEARWRRLLWTIGHRCTRFADARLANDGDGAAARGSGVFMPAPILLTALGA